MASLPRVLLFLAAVAAVSSAMRRSAVGFNNVWGYLPSAEEPYGPDNWYRAFPYAAGKQQSPIDIVTSNVVTTHNLDELDIEWEKADAEITNNGASVEIEIEDPTKNVLVDAYGVKYYLNSVHFHWHQYNDSLGSEHTIDGASYVLEGHFVHFKASFDSLNAAVAHNTTGDVSVIGVLFKVGETNSALSGIVKAMGTLAAGDEPNASYLIDLEDFEPEELLPEEAEDSYYHYKGGLTTPVCAEVVHWYVLKEVQHLSAAQLEAFRSVKHDADGNITSNFRPVQPLNGRTVYLRKESSSRKSKAWIAAPVIIGAALLAIGVPAAVFIYRRRSGQRWENLQRQAQRDDQLANAQIVV